MKTKLLILSTGVALTARAFAQDTPKPVTTRDAVQAQVQVQSQGQSPGETRGWTPVAPLVPAKPGAFLGVATTPVPPVLAAQLGLPEGFGLVVEEVVPESPASKAGVQRFDVLKLFNDQQLVDPSQLAALVRAAGKDASVSVTLLRKGQEQKVNLQVAERPMPVRVPFPGPDGGVKKQIERLKDGVGDKLRKIDDQGRELKERGRELQDRVFQWQPGPQGAGGQMQFQSSAGPADVLREVRPGGAARVQVIEPNGIATYNTASAKLLMKDESGVIEITADNGERRLVAKNPAGAVIFEGPINTPEQRKALPDDLRRKLETIEFRTTQEFSVPVPGPNAVFFERGSGLEIQ